MPFNGRTQACSAGSTAGAPGTDISPPVNITPDSHHGFEVASAALTVESRAEPRATGSDHPGRTPPDLGSARHARRPLRDRCRSADLGHGGVASGAAPRCSIHGDDRRADRQIGALFRRKAGGVSATRDRRRPTHGSARKSPVTRNRSSLSRRVRAREVGQDSSGPGLCRATVASEGSATTATPEARGSVHDTGRVLQQPPGARWCASPH